MRMKKDRYCLPILLHSHILSLNFLSRGTFSSELFQYNTQLGVAQLALAASVIVPFITTRTMVGAGTSAMEAMREDRKEEALRREAIRLEEKEERRRGKMEDRIFLLSAAVLACVVYKYI